MALLPSSNTCCEPCDEPTSVAVPGPAGADGAAGADGTDGVSAFTFVASEAPDPQPVMPAEGGTVTINTTTSTSFLTTNQFAYVAFWGYMKVAAIPSDTSLTLLNPEVTASSQYTENAPPGTSLPALSRITCAGIQGPAGASGGGGDLLAANNLSDVDDVATSRSNLGLGDAATKTVGVANSNLPAVDDAGGLTATEALFATASGIESQAAATARTSLGLGSMATQAAGAVAITGGSVTGITDITVADGGTGSSTAAGARSNLGLTLAVGAYGLFRQEETDGTAGGDFTSGAWRTVGLNTEVVDTGAAFSIAANQVTLPAGTYRYRFGVVGFQVDAFQGRLYNITDAGVISDSYGTVARSLSTDGVTAVAEGQGRFTLAGAKAIELQAQCTTTNAGDGFGVAASFGVGEVYSWLEIWQEAG